MLKTYLVSHAVHIGMTSSALAGWAIRHYWSDLSNWFFGQGTDEAIMFALSQFKALASKYLSSDEIKQIETLAAQAALRASEDIQKDVAKPS